MSVVAWVPLVAAAPYTSAYDAGNGDIYIVDFLGSYIDIVNGTTLSAETHIQGPDPSSEFMSYDSGDGYVYVPDYGEGNLSVMDDASVVDTIAVGNGSEFAVYDRGNGDEFVTNYLSDNVSVVSGTTVVATIDTGTGPWNASYDSGNGYIYVTNRGSDNVSAIFTPYNVTFNETGLPRGTGWWINVTGGPATFSKNTTLSFVVGNGTYEYSASSEGGFYASPAGRFTVRGACCLRIDGIFSRCLPRDV